MQVVPAGVSLPFEVSSYDDQGDLFPAMLVFETTTGTPVFLSLVAMQPVAGGTYVAFFTPLAGKTYLMRKAFYTDGTYNTVDPMRSPGSETVYATEGTYSNEMSTAYDDGAGTQELIAWANKNGQRVSGTNCTVTVKSSTGTVVWTLTLSSPNADGVFRFSKVVALTQNEDYYVVIAITVDGAVRTSQRPFMTVA